MKQVWIKFISTVLMFTAIAWIFGTGIEGINSIILGYLLFEHIRNNETKD